VLERTELKTSIRLMEMAQQWQVKATAQSDKPQMTMEELKAECGMDYDAIHKAIFGEPAPLDDDEDPDPYRLKTRLGSKT
jgi:hypothetical protein